MEKRGTSRLVLIISVAILIVLTAFLYLYTSEEKVELTPEEQKTAESLDLTPKEFKDISEKSYDVFIRGKPFYENAERPERMIGYSKGIPYETISDERVAEYVITRFKESYNIQDVEIKPDSKIIVTELGGTSPTPYIIYLIEDGKVKVLVENLNPSELD